MRKLPSLVMKKELNGFLFSQENENGVFQENAGLRERERERVSLFGRKRGEKRRRRFKKWNENR